MKVSASVRTICKDCRIVRRGRKAKKGKGTKRIKGGANGNLYVICSSNPKHKQSQA